MQPNRLPSLRDWLSRVAGACGRLFAADATVALGDLACGSSLGSALPQLSGRSVLVATADQLTSALALIELDGLARRLTICPPDLPADQFAHVIATAEVDAIVSSGNGRAFGACDIPLYVTCSPSITPMVELPPRPLRTEWIMLTSGTTGVPKMVVHTLESLTGAIKPRADGEPMVWGTFYDIRRYGGLQIFLRAIMCGASLVLSQADEPMAGHLGRLGRHGVTHLSGTPSHWRKALMSPAISAIAPRYVRLSGEIADQSILDNLRAAFPQAGVAHAYASTEAGVGFEVNDGREGFPAQFLVGSGTDVAMKVVDGSLRLRSRRAATRYLNHDAPALADADGFIDSGDIVELRDDRYYFVGRRGGIINVGGLKVHPEEIEAVINRHPRVRMSLVRARKNPITGAIVVADVVLRQENEDGAAEVKREILQSCRDRLPQHKVPASIRFVASLDVGVAGKLARHNA